MIYSIFQMLGNLAQRYNFHDEISNSFNNYNLRINKKTIGYFQSVFKIYCEHYYRYQINLLNYYYYKIILIVVTPLLEIARLLIKKPPRVKGPQSKKDVEYYLSYFPEFNKSYTSKPLPIEILPTIYISIASLKDSQCPITLANIYAYAKYPSRIHVGIFEQNDVEDCPSYLDLACIPKDKVTVQKIPASEAKGPCFARYHCSKMYNKEDYFFQIDSHTRFVQDWDVKLLSMYKEYCQYHKLDKIVLSHYPGEFNVESDSIPDDYQSKFSVMTGAYLSNKNMLYLKCNSVSNNLPKEKLMAETCLSGACFLFMPGSALAEVPFDPTLDYVFEGEEIMYSARLFAAGYKICAPYINLCFHFFFRNNFKRIQDIVPDYNKLDKRGRAKIANALYLKDQYQKHFSKASQRSKSDYESKERKLLELGISHFSSECEGLLPMYYPPKDKVEEFFSRIKIMDHAK
jgi:hypothetical protein